MVTIQITFMQKVMAFAPLVDCQMMSMSDSGDITDDVNGCNQSMHDMSSCSSDCDMMNVVSTTHFVESKNTLHFLSYSFNYPDFVSTIPLFFPSSLYRPPLFS